MKKISVKQTIKIVLIIWGTSIILNSLLLTIFFSLTEEVAIKQDISFSFFEKLLVLIILSAKFTIPSFIILFFGLRYIYIKINTAYFRFLSLFFLAIINSISVLGIIYYAKNKGFLIVVLVYIVVSFVTTIAVPFIKRKLFFK